MSCAPFDLRDYFLGELGADDRARMKQHVAGCEGCAGELRRLEAVEAALLSVREEEIPQRIAFVSDRVYEPSRLRRWWVAFWNSAPRLGFASAAMVLAAAVVYSEKPAAVPVATVDMRAVRAEFHEEMNTAVTRAVAQVEARHAEELQTRVAAVEQRFEAQRQKDMRVAADAFRDMVSRMNVYYRASVDWKEPQ